MEIMLFEFNFLLTITKFSNFPALIKHLFFILFEIEKSFELYFCKM